MALLFADSFDHYSDSQITRKWDARNSPGGGPTFTIGAAAGRNSTAGVGTSASGAQDPYIKKAIASGPATIVLGFACKVANLPSSTRQLCSFFDNGTKHVDARMRADGLIEFTRNGTVLGTSSIGVNAGQYNYFEIKATINDTTGVGVVKINGVTVINLSGVDTRNGANAVVNEVYLPSDAVGALVPILSASFDDVYILDTTGATNNDFLGDVQVRAIFPTGAGNYTQWTPSAGSNWQNVDDNPPNDDTDYNSESTAADKDSFVFGDVTPASGTVYAVAVNLHARKDDAGTRTIRSLARLSGTDAFGVNVNITTSYTNYQQVMETKPGGGAWSITDVNNSEYGYELVA